MSELWLEHVKQKTVASLRRSRVRVDDSHMWATPTPPPADPCHPISGTYSRHEFIMNPREWEARPRPHGTLYSEWNTRLRVAPTGEMTCSVKGTGLWYTLGRLTFVNKFEYVASDGAKWMMAPHRDGTQPAMLHDTSVNVLWKQAS